MIFVTGATGFVGRALVSALLAMGNDIKVLVRQESTDLSDNVQQIQGSLESIQALNSSLTNVNVLIHCAARVHIMDDPAADSLIEFRKVNVDATLNLARQASEAGVKRFIFLSSIKVNGEITSDGQTFKDDDTYIPTDPYGLSKYEAEQGLLALARETGMEVVIIRPPLVYGPNVKANFASMMKWVSKGIPLPLGAINNQRSLVALDNLVSFIIQCIEHPKAANEVFLISDGDDVSTSDLLRRVAKAFDKKSWLVPVPVWLMAIAAKLIGKGDMASRLFSSLQIDNSKARNLLDWKPVITMGEQLKKTADAYLKHEKTL